MHIQEVFNAINKNHMYEYIVVDEDLNIAEYSDKVFLYCQNRSIDCKKVSVLDVVPELYGVDEVIAEIFKGERSFFTLPYIFKEPDVYLNIHIAPGREKGESGTKNNNRYETLIILFENITEQANMQQKLVQTRNEKALLLDEILEKNTQLERYNKEMQQIVDEEIRKNLEKQKMLELQSRYAQMGEIISMITHQWKQPLNVIGLITHALKIYQEKGELSGRILDEKLENILVQTRYMDQTVSDFQNFFSPSKVKIAFNVYDALENILGLVQYEYSHKNIKINIEGDKEAQVYGYPNEFKQVILTLLQNARDAFKENPADEMIVTIGIQRKGEQVLVRVKDNAGGIPEKIMEKLFDLYVTTKEDGSGLGLNIAKNMIEKNMGGVLSVQNVDGGAEFRIHLPAYIERAGK